PGDWGLQLIVAGRGTHGGRRDLTGSVTWQAEPEGVVRVEAGGYVRPIGPGQAKVRATLGDDRAEAVVTVADQAHRAWDFGLDVVPVLTRAGCNSGGCHGKADGQNGFHL